MPERLLGEPLEGWDPEERPPDQCPQVFHGNCRVSFFLFLLGPC